MPLRVSARQKGSMNCSKCRDRFPLAEEAPNVTTCPQCTDFYATGTSEADRAAIKAAYQCPGCGCYGVKTPLCHACLLRLMSEEALPFPLSTKPAIVKFFTESHQAMNMATAILTPAPSPVTAAASQAAAEAFSPFSQAMPVPASQVSLQPQQMPDNTAFLNAVQQTQLSQLNALAPAYQAQASDHRLTGRSQNQQLRQGTKTKALINEQRKEGKEGKIASLQIGALAYFLHNAEFKEPTPLSQVGPFCDTYWYQTNGGANQQLPLVNISTIIDSFLSKIAERIAEVFPGSRPVTSENVELRIKHGVKKTLWALDKSTRNQLNALTGVDALYRMAVSRGWMTMGQHNLMIAFIVSNDEVILEMIGKTAKKKKRGASEALDVDELGWDESDFDRGSSSTSRPSRQGKNKRQSIVSTFRRPSGPALPTLNSAVRAPPLLHYKTLGFTLRQECTVDAGTGDVTFSEPSPFFIENKIEISDGLVKGYDLIRGIVQPDHDPATYYEYGVLGKGYYKVGVDALYNKKHVAFLFYHGDGFGPSMASEEAKLGLMSELEALKLGQEVFLPAFAGTLESAGFKTLPKLRFNSDNAFLGQISLPEPITVRKVDVQHPQGYPDGRTYALLETGGWFLATSLLPYGPTKPQVIKFTGADGDGESPRDASEHDKLAEEVVQAFAHFVYIYSKQSRLLVDLQGVWAADGAKTVTLIDPQLLKSEIQADKQKIECYMKNHVCRRLCQALYLNTAEAASPSSSGDEDGDKSGDYNDNEDELDEDE